MNKLEQAYNQQRNQKYGIDKLSVERVRRTSDLIDQPRPTTPNKFEEQQRRDRQQKFGMNGLQLEGALPQKEGKTLEDAVREDAKQPMNGMKLATAKVTFQNKPVRLWFEISR